METQINALEQGIRELSQTQHEQIMEVSRMQVELARMIIDFLEEKTL